MTRGSAPRLTLLLLWFALVLGAALWAEGRFWVSADQWFERARAAAEAGRTEEAIERTRKGLDDSPYSAGMWRFKGYRELEAGRPDSAVRSFARALAADTSRVDAALRQLEGGRPDSALYALGGDAAPDARTRLGYAEALLEAGRPDSAVAVLEDLSGPGLRRESRIRKAELLAAADAPARALAAYRSALAEPPESEELVRSAARVAAMVGRWQVVAALTGRLMERTDGRLADAEMTRLRARALERTGQTAAALDAYERIASPENLETRAGLARALGRDSLAASLYARLAARPGRHPEHARSLALTLDRSGQRARARAVYDSLYRAGVLSRGMRVRYADMLWEDGRTDAAWRVLSETELAAARPGEVRLWVETALASGRLDRALALTRRHLTDEEASPADLRLAYRIHAEAGEPGRAADALGRYLEARPGDGEAGFRRVGLLMAAGREEEAVRQGERLLDRLSDPEPASLTRLGHQMEQAGAPKLARRAYLRLVETADPSPPPDVLRRLARIHSQLGRPDEAVDWFGRYREEVGPGSRRDATDLPYARALLSSGRPQEAVELLGPPETLSGSEALMVLARAAQAAGRSARAADALSALSEERALDRSERRWRAGLLRRSGQPRAALAAYEDLLPADRAEDAGEIEAARAVGDLRLQLGRPDGGADAYRLLPDSVLASTSAGLNLARALTESGDRAGALEWYGRHLRSEGAVPPAVSIEAARAALAADRYELAEAWTRSALEEGADAPRLRLLLAESLRFRGDVRAASRRLESVPSAAPDGVDPDEWTARIARVRDRHLAAGRAFGRAVADAPATSRSASLRVEWARAALSRGDYRRARRRLEAGAGEMGAALRRRLERAAAPGVGYGAGSFTDSNDFRHHTWLDGRFSLWPASGLRLHGRAEGATLRQGGVSQDRWRAAVGIDSLFPSPRLRLAAEAGVEGYGGREEELLAGDVQAIWAAADVTRVRLRLDRSSVWAASSVGGPRRFNHVTSLPRLLPQVDFGRTRLTAALEQRIGDYARITAGAHGSRLDDGNRRLALSGRYELPLWSGPSRFLAVSPSGYAAWNEEDTPGLFTPESYYSLGAGMHGIRRWDALELEVELNPYGALQDGDAVGGAWSIVALGWRPGILRLSAGGIGVLETDGYRAGRIFGRVELGAGVF